MIEAFFRVAALAALFAAPPEAPATAAVAGAAPAEPLAPAAISAYVLLTEASPGKTVALARVIVAPDAACPVLVETAMRGHAKRLATRPRRNPHGFAVKVCETVYPFGRRFQVEGGPELPAVAAAPERVVVLGDSGCKPKDQDGCTLDDPAWPLPRLAAAAAKSTPDLVLHVGDYNYRGTPSGFEKDGKKLYYYDAGDGAPVAENCGLEATYYSQNSPGNKDADSWEAWWLDFFEPAAPLLGAAPWVFARGNHELCAHAGPGFFYFLDGGSDLLPGGQISCPEQQDGAPPRSQLVLLEPRVLALGGLELLLLDSANACDQLPGLAADYRRQLAGAARRLEGDAAWLVTHRPVWGIDGTADPVYGCDGTASKAPALPFGQLNQSLQCALAGADGAALLPRLGLILAGHMHRFETLSFAAPTDRPPTLVVGNSGVAEDSGPPLGAFAQALDGSLASGFTLTQFGYLELDRKKAGGWRGRVLAVDPAAWSPYLEACGGGEPPLCAAPLP